jgi:hypothetical protein
VHTARRQGIGHDTGDVGVAGFQRQPHAQPDIFLAHQPLFDQLLEQRCAGRRHIAPGEPQGDRLAQTRAIALCPFGTVGVALMGGIGLHQTGKFGHIERPRLARAERLQPVGAQRFGHAAAGVARKKIGDARVISAVC